MNRRVTTRECQRCGHVWLPRHLDKPTVCPKGRNSGCGSVQWDKPPPALASGAQYFRVTFASGVGAMMGHADTALEIWRAMPDEAKALRVRWQGRTYDAIQFAAAVQTELEKQESFDDMPDDPEAYYNFRAEEMP